MDVENRLVSSIVYHETDITTVNAFSVSKFWRKLCCQDTVVSQDTEEPQVQGGTSKVGAQREMEGTVEMQ